MANIVNIDSLGFDEILADIEKYLSIPGEIDLSDFNESSAVRRFTSALAALYDQLKTEIISTRREGIMHSAVNPESIRQLAQSQLAYNPKRKIAPQHPVGEHFEFYAKQDSGLTRYAVIGQLTVGDESYPISIINPLEANPVDENLIRCRLGIGSWRRVDIEIDETLGHLEPYHVFHIDEELYVIDDSNTTHISINNDENVVIRSNLYDIFNVQSANATLDEDLRRTVLVTNNLYGGLDLNFGDGLIFGNLLYNGQATRVSVHYFVTPGFIPNLTFTPDDITWDANYVDDSKFDVDADGRPLFNIRMANGIYEETTAQIKTLSPYVAMSNQRIMTNDDFITRVRRIPQIKSCASRPRHIHPHEMTASNYLVPTATFELTALTHRPISDPIEAEWVDSTLVNVDPATFTAGTIIKVKQDSSVEDEPDYTYYVMTTRIFDEGGTAKYIYDDGVAYDLLHAVKLADETLYLNVGSWWNNPPDSDFYNKLYIYAPDIDDDEHTFQHINISNPWLRISDKDLDLYTETMYQPLTQAEWDLRYHTQWNFDRLLGFMRVRVLPPVEHGINFVLKLVLKPNLDINARTHLEIDRAVRDIIGEYCFELGAFLDTGKIVADIVSIDEVLQCYIESPVQNKQLQTTHYIKPLSISIQYQTSPNEDNRYATGG